MAELHELSVAEAGGLIRGGKLSPLDLVRAYLDRIARYDKVLASYVTVTADLAEQQARRAADDVVRGRPLGPLHGIPVSFKDTIATAGVRTTAASALYADRVPDQDASVVTRARRAGAVLLGKANLMEMGYLGVQRVKNPWDPTRSPGASSGGSAAGVAAGLAAASIGTDSGGSIRNPAAFCGVTGLKPTFGRISRQGILPLSVSCDTVGPLARSAEDCAAVLGAVAGHDPADRASLRDAVPDHRSALGRSLKGVKIGVCRDFVTAAGVTPAVGAAFDTALAEFRRQGAVLEDVVVPYHAYAKAVNWTLMRAEGFQAHRSNLKAHRDKYSPTSFRALAVGGFLGAADYLRAQQARALLAGATAEVLTSVDVLAMPTNPAAGGDGLRPQPAPGPPGYASFSSLANLTGGPAISIPCGFTAGGMPIGLQLLGRPNDDATVLAVAHQYQLGTDWHLRRPTIAASR